MKFGDAIEALKQGCRVTRDGWNGRGMYLWLMPAAQVSAGWCRETHLKALAEANGGTIDCLPSIRMYTVNREGRKAVLTGWLASQTDIMADDWQVVGGEYRPNALPPVEDVAAAVHERWMETKRAAGVTSRKSETGEELMVAYHQLSEKAKDLDRQTVLAVYNAIALTR